MWILYAACRSARYLFMIAITISGSALPAMAQSRAPLIINSDLGGRVGVRAKSSDRFVSRLVRCTWAQAMSVSAPKPYSDFTDQVSMAHR
jgi:hypothetical protein